MSEVRDITVEILREIRDAVRETNRRIDRMDVRLSAGQEQTNVRLDHLIELAGGKWREHDRRISSLETRVEAIEVSG